MRRNRDATKFGLRIPDDLGAWLEEQISRNASNRNAEIVRSIRERMDRETATRQPQSAA